MKRILKRMAAFLLCTALTIPAMPANAAYTPEQVALSLRPMQTEDSSYAIYNDTVYLTPAQVEDGMRVHMGIFIEATHDDVMLISVKAQSSSKSITFDEASYYNPSTSGYTEEEVTYTLSDGTTFSTTYKPFCFGMLTSQGSYRANGFGVYTAFDAEENSVTSMLLNTKTMEFFGGASDELSYIEFDVVIAPETEPGVYDISFVHDAEGESLGHTYISSDNGSGGYDDVFPTLKNAKIVISDQAHILLEQPEPQFYFVDDTEQIALSEFFSGVTRVIAARDDRFYVETLDLTQLSVHPADGIPDDLHDYCSSVGSMVIVPGVTETLSPNGYLQKLIESSEENDVTMRADQLFTVYHLLAYEGTQLLHEDGTEAMAVCYVGLRGDANSDGIADSADASKILQYAGNKGSGNPASLTGASTNASHLGEKMLYFLSDITGQSLSCGEDGSALDAVDASLILQYAALEGSGLEADWDSLIP